MNLIFEITGNLAGQPGAASGDLLPAAKAPTGVAGARAVLPSPFDDQVAVEAILSKMRGPASSSPTA